VLRSILLLLDETQAAVAACGVAASLARRCSAQLGGIYFAPPGVRSQGDLSESEAYRSLQLTMPSASVVVSRQAPEPGLREAMEAHDVLVIGRDSTLGAEPAKGRIAPAVLRLIYEIGRPLLIVPPHAPAEGRRALIAREPDIFFRRTLHMCLLLGLFHGLKVKPYASAGGKEAAGVGLAALLEKYDIECEAEEDVEGSVTEKMMAQGRAEKAGLIVSGEFGRFAFGRYPSVAAAKAFGAHCALFVYH
jgi:hypothetical protein